MRESGGASMVAGLREQLGAHGTSEGTWHVRGRIEGRFAGVGGTAAG